MSTTFDKVAEIIAETCDIPRENIKPESHAINDLEIDSLDFLDIAFAIDKAFGIKLPLEQWTQEGNDGKASTDQYFVLKNLCERIVERIAAKGAWGAEDAPRIFSDGRPLRRSGRQRARRSRHLQRAEREPRLRRALSRLSGDAGRALDRVHGADHRLAGQRAHG